MTTRSAQTDAWGISERYLDASRRWRRVSPGTREAIRCSMGDPPALGSERHPVQTLRAGRSLRLDQPVELTLEDGTALRLAGKLPPDLPIGYHQLRFLREEHTTRLIIHPGKCYLPETLQAWGWATQLYAVRSRRSWGIGDLGDLRQLARWSARKWGADFLLLNPLSAALPLPTQEPSPYYPSSRRFRNPLYLRIEEIPGARAAGAALHKLAQAGQALNQERRIDRNAVFQLKLRALDQLWNRFGGSSKFDRYCQQEGIALWEYATFCALVEHHGCSWKRWPDSHRRPGNAAVKRFATQHARRVRFHQWLQWLLDEQLARAAGELPLMQDLPVGVAPDGADAWAWQDILAQNVSVGAPPDAFNAAGQNWGLPPFVPHKLRAAGYEPFRQTIRAALRHAGGLRIDHVMGLFRLFWIPQGISAREGAFVRYRSDEMLAILAIESQRAKAVIIGEDLGTVEPGVREALRQWHMLSYRLLWFESKPVARYPRRSLAAVTTHDLFTIAGLWNGSDLRAQQQAGVPTNATGTERIRKRLSRTAGIAEDASARTAILQTHKLLARSPSMLLTATLDDALGVEERPNLPGTTGESWPNWSLALPEPLERICNNPMVGGVARSLDNRTPPSSSGAGR